MDLYEAIQQRRSVRKYRSDPIPGASLNRILQAIQRSPSWANRQPWELILVSDESLKAQLQNTLPSTNPAYKCITRAPIIACFIGIRGLSGWYKGETVTNRGDWFMFDIGIASEHLALAATAEGLGTVHVGLFDNDQVDKIFNLPDDRTVVELLPMGYPDHEPRLIDRKDITSFVFYDRYNPATKTSSL